MGLVWLYSSRGWGQGVRLWQRLCAMQHPHVRSVPVLACFWAMMQGLLVAHSMVACCCCLHADWPLCLPAIAPLPSCALHSPLPPPPRRVQAREANKKEAQLYGKMFAALGSRPARSSDQGTAGNNAAAAADAPSAAAAAEGDGVAAAAPVVETAA